MNQTPLPIPAWRENAPAGVPLSRLIEAAPKPASRGHVPWAMDRIIRPEVRANWLSSRLRTITPDHVEMILASSLSGSLTSAHELFQLMEDTWPRLQKNLGELKRAVLQLEWKVKPWTEEDMPPTDLAKERAALVSHCLWRMNPAAESDESGIKDTMFDLLDAWAKGVSVLEILWDRAPVPKFGDMVVPRATAWVSPQSYAWSAEAGAFGLTMPAPGDDLSQPRIGSSGTVHPFPPHKFIIARCRARTGHPLAGALLRPLAWWWVAANFSAEWYLNFAQIFGLPIRWATYDPTVPGLESKLAAMLESMGSSGWAAMPNGTQLELKDPVKDGTNNPTAAMLDRADKQCDLLILGQTLTTDVADSGSRALGDVHADVRSDVIMAAAEWLEEVLERQLIPAILRLNYGDTDEAPEICAEPHREEDRKGNAERDKILLDAGVAMPREWFYKRHDIPLPQAGEETIGKPPAPDPAPIPPGDAPDNEPSRKAPADAVQSSGIPHAHALHARSAQEKLADNVLEDLTGVEAAWLGGARPWFRKLITAARDPEITDAEFVALLSRAQANVPQELAPLLDPSAVAVALEGALGAACVNGAVSAYAKRKASK
jgi:phage gp29-like protein